MSFAIEANDFLFKFCMHVFFSLYSTKTKINDISVTFYSSFSIFSEL